MKSLHKIIATAFGAGYSPIAPGTAGAIVACGLYVLLMSGQISWFNNFSMLHFFALTVLVTGAGVISSNYLEKDWGKDPQRIVVDEVAGQWIALLFVPFAWKYVIIALILFRFFDISKILGIRKAEALPSGFGVMMDDVVAGIYANIVLQILIYLGV